MVVASDGAAVEYKRVMYARNESRRILRYIIARYRYIYYYVHYMLSFPKIIVRRFRNPTITFYNESRWSYYIRTAYTTSYVCVYMLLYIIFGRIIYWKASAYYYTCVR